MTRRQKKSAAIAADLMFAPMVAMMRLPLMSAEAQKFGHIPAETMRAGSEKMVAFAEGAVAAQMAYAKAMMSFWPEVMTGRTPSILNSSMAESAAQAALGPASRKVKANYRRLGARKTGR